MRSPIDRFILAKLEAAGQRPAPPADRRIWLRRVTYDLTGLPPLPEDVAAFLADESPTAQQNVVERLLESPHYGEHWGRHWLDVVRYADTAGENSDHPLPHAWRYRNWVIDAFNADLPYDEFLRDQIAGDLRAAAGPAEQAADRIVATGYLAIARRFGHDIDKDIHLTLEDTLDTLGKSVLGLTIGCCRCHDHKYDPLSTRDYYGLYGIFSSTKFAFPGCEPQQQPRDLTPLWSAEEIERQSRPIRAELAKVDAALKTLGEQQAALRTAWKEATAGSTRLLSSADVGEGQALALNTGATTGLNAIEVRQGQLLQLSILPQGNHGADSTRVEWEIAEAGGDGRKWSTADLIPDLLAGNPHADTYGHAGTWFFLDAKDGLALLPESVGQVNGRPELQAWRSGDTPSVFVNRSNQPSPVWTMLPAKSFFVHPGPGGPVAVAWRSPIDGMVSITGTIEDAHPAGGLDGVAWRLEQIASAAAGETLTKLQTLEQQAAALNRQRAELMARQPKTPLAYAVSEGTPAHADSQPGRTDEPGGRGPAEVSGCPRRASRPADGDERPAGAGGLAGEPDESADGPGDGQPDLAMALRPGTGGVAERFRHARHAANTSRTARFPGGRVREKRLERQSDEPAGSLQRDIRRKRAGGTGIGCTLWPFRRSPADGGGTAG